jgi:hypothetical protein
MLYLRPVGKPQGRAIVRSPVLTENVLSCSLSLRLRSLPLKDSHICCTPWSVFQDGSVNTISSTTFRFKWPTPGVPIVCAQVCEQRMHTKTKSLRKPCAPKSEPGDPQSHTVQRQAAITPRPESPGHLPLGLIHRAKLLLTCQANTVHPTRES